MHRGRTIILITGIVLLILLVYFTFPGMDERNKTLETDYFCRTLRIISPPHYAVQKGTELKFERLLDRITWGTNKSVHWTIDCLVSEKKRPFLSEIERRINLFRSSEPSRAKRYIDLLAELDEPPSLFVFIKCAEDPSQMVRHAALKGVSRFDAVEATDCLLKGTEREEWNTKSLCLGLLQERKDPKTLKYFEDAIRNSNREVLSFAMKALSNHGSEEYIPLIRPFAESKDFTLRTVAVQSLLRLNDPRAYDWLYENLRNKGPVIRGNSVKSLVYAKEVPPKELMESLARDQEDEIRMLFVSVLVEIIENHQGESLRRIEDSFHILRDDPRPEIRLKALEGLYNMGRRDVTTPFLRKLKQAYGGELNEALSFLTRTLAVQEAGPILVERFKNDAKLTAEDRLVLLEGISELGYPDGMDIFFEVIRGGWNSRWSLEPPITLDCRAAYIVHNIEGDVLSQWLGVLEDDDSDHMVYLFLNGARNLEDSRSADTLLNLAHQSHRPLWLRRETVLSFAFLKDMSLGEKLLVFAAREKNPDLSKLAYKVFWNYF